MNSSSPQHAVDSGPAPLQPSLRSGPPGFGVLRRVGGGGRWVALLLLVAGLGVTGWQAQLVNSDVDAEAKLEFDADCYRVQVAIEERLHALEQILRSGAAFFADTDGVTREEWHQFAERQKVSQHLPGIQGLGFAMWVPGPQLAAHVQAVRAEGFSGYRVWPEDEREAYTSIAFLEPFTGRNLRAFGYDMFTEPVRRAAMETARDEDRTALTGKVKLVQEDGEDVQAGTLMYAPVYQMGAACATVAERRAALIGWVYSPYRMNDLMAGVLDRGRLVNQKQLRLQIHDGTIVAPAAMLYDSLPQGDESPAPPPHWIQQMSVNSAGRQWLLSFSKIDAAGKAAGQDKVWLAIGAGGSISLLLAGLALSLVNTRSNAHQLANHLSKDLRETTYRLSLASRAGGVGIWDYDVVRDKLVWDAQMFRLYGITREQFSGAYAAWQAGLHPADRQRGETEIQLALLDIKKFDTEFRVVWPDGTTRHIRGFAVVERDGAGKPLHMIGTNWDITERKHIDAELARLSVIQSTLLRLATEFVNVPVNRRDVAINESLATMGQLIAADQAYLVGYDFEAGFMSCTHEWCAPGIPLQIVGPQALPIAPVQDRVAIHQRGEALAIPDVAALPQDDVLRHLLQPRGIRSIITLPLMQDGICLGFIGFNAVRELRTWVDEEMPLLQVLAELYANFHARSTMEREAGDLQNSLLKARDAAQATAVAKGRFLADMSHEIRTPLNSVLGYAQIMEHECRTCPTRARLKPITRSGEHLLRLATDLLDLARDDGQKITLAAMDFDFYQLLEDVRLMFAGALEARGMVLELACAGEVPQFIHADPTKVRQILVNLLSNAAKFTTQGGVRVSASLLNAAAADGVSLAVDVDDTGCGIADGELERIFQAFEQAEHGVKSGKGAGLGLALSRRYARVLGGGISVASSLGRGSCFRFTFNARVASSGAPKPSHPEWVLGLAPEQPACHLLVVDDELENRSMLKTMLTAVGFTVETAAGAAQALEFLRQAKDVALVLIDKNMPELSGYEAIRLLRALPGGSNLPVLVVSASGFDREGDLARAAGADGYIAKPVRRELLLAEIARLAGVRYEYDAAEPDHATPVPLAPAALAGLAAGQLQLFKQALLRGDTQELRQLIAEIAITDGGLAVGLGLLLDAYDYASLHRLLASAQKTHL